MSDSQDTGQENEGSDESEGIKNLRAKAASAEAAEARALLAEKKLAFAEAGVPLGSKPAEAFLASYSGEMTPDAIKAEAADWNLLPSEQTPTPDNTPKFDSQSEERKLQDERSKLEGTGAVADPNETPKKGGVDGALDGFKKAREQGTSRQQAVNEAFGAVIKAAAMGDPQANFDPAKWQEQQRQAGHGAEHAR